jgi:protein-S-isoprenylcysteine O-methyltransferase Ste14
VSQPPQAPPEPDIAVLLMMIAFACLATLGELALIVAAPIWVIWLGTLVPVFFWAILLRQVHRFLRDGQPEDAPSWTEDTKRLLERRRQGDGR